MSCVGYFDYIGYFSASIGFFFYDWSNSYGGYFLVRKNGGEYKNENWVKILRSDSWELFFDEKNGKKWGNIRMKIGTNFEIFDGKNWGNIRIFWG